jgi:DNA polymerase elongation subunit (family B)
MRELFYFDIETVSEYRSYSDFLENDPYGAKLFKEKSERLDWLKNSTISDVYVEKAGFYSTFGRICCISCGFKNNLGENKIYSFYDSDEYQILNDFNNLLKQVEKKNFNICGYGINQFDIPWVMHKFHKYSIVPAEILSPYNKKPWDMRITDLSDDWKGKNVAYSFNEVLL